MFGPILRVSVGLVLGGMTLSWVQGASAQEPLVSGLDPIRRLAAQALTDDQGAIATDISGIACLPRNDAVRVCLVINDEDSFAQLAILEEDGRLLGRDRVRLIGTRPSDLTVGQEPQEAACSDGKGRFKDLDGEAVAFSSPYFYVVGSHGCSRHGNKFRLSSFVLARIRVDGQGKPEGQEAETSYRLADALRSAPGMTPYFTADLEKANGLNVEGLAVIGRRMIVGLRAPVVAGQAFLVSLDLDHVFARASVPPADVRVVPLRLGAKLGVRDLAPLPDGRLLVLAGPAQEQEAPFSVFLVDLASSAGPRHLATLAEVGEGKSRGKAEAIVALDATDSFARVLVLFDGLPNGGPREYRLPLR